MLQLSKTLTAPESVGTATVLLTEVMATPLSLHKSASARKYLKCGPIHTGTDSDAPSLSVGSILAVGASLVGTVTDAVREVLVEAQTSDITAGAAERLGQVQHVGDTGLLRNIR
jgi:hypothetical protein